MKSYSLDLRTRVIRLHEKGEKQGQIAELLGISISTVKRYLARQRQTGSLGATVQRRAQPMLEGAQLAVIEAQLQAHSDWTLKQHVALFAEQTGRVVSESTFGRAVARLGWTRKKRQWVPKSETLGHGTHSPN